MELSDTNPHRLRRRLDAVNREELARSRTAGTTTAVCAACGGHVVVPQMAGLKPRVVHCGCCPRNDWPVLDATKYDDGTQATLDNWVDRES